MPDRRVLAAGLRRFAKLTAGAVAIVTVLSLVIGLLFGHGVLRSVTLGFYLTGSLLVIMGFFHAHRGPLRPDDAVVEERGPFHRGRVRQATLAEREEALSSSAVFVSLGIVLFVIGVVLDTV